MPGQMDIPTHYAIPLLIVAVAIPLGVVYHFQQAGAASAPLVAVAPAPKPPRVDELPFGNDIDKRRLWLSQNIAGYMLTCTPAAATRVDSQTAWNFCTCLATILVPQFTMDEEAAVLNGQTDSPAMATYHKKEKAATELCNKKIVARPERERL